MVEFIGVCTYFNALKSQHLMQCKANRNTMFGNSIFFHDLETNKGLEI